MSGDSFLAEPGIYLGSLSLAGTARPFFLPPESALAHTLITSRSGGGKSHTLATWSLGIARLAATRYLNRQVSDPAPPPVSLGLFDPHSGLARQVLEDIARLVASVRVARWQGAAREKWNNSRQLAGHSPAETRKILEPLLRQHRPITGWWEDILAELSVFLNLSDREFPFGLNLLDTFMWDSKETCASTVITIMKRLYPDSWGVRLEDLLRNTLFALFLLNTCRFRGCQFTLLDVVPFITIDPLREALLELPVIREDNPALYAWWKIQFAQKMDERFRNEVIKPVLNKINPFLTSDLLSRILGQPATTLDFAPLIAAGGIILVDLAAAELEAENAALAGAVLVGFLLRQVRQGAGTIHREEERPLVQLVVDEFNSLPAVPYGRIFAEDRKFGVRALLATQSLKALDRLDPLLRPLVMANQANLLALQVNAEDAAYLREELVADGTGGEVKGYYGTAGGLTNPAAGGGGANPDLYDLVNAPRGLAYAKFTLKGRRRPVCSIRIAPRFRPPAFLIDAGLEKLIERESREIMLKILRRSRREHGTPAGEIGDYLRRKEREYLAIFELKLPDPESSALFSGFEEKLRGPLLRELHFWLEVEARRREEAAARRGYRPVGKKTTPKSEKKESAEEEGEEGQVRPEENMGKKATGNGKKKAATEKKPEPAPGPLPAYGPDWKVPPPVRSKGTPALDREKGLNMQDGRDYRAETQVKEKRKALLDEQRRKAGEVVAARDAREQGKAYGKEAYQKLQARGKPEPAGEAESQDSEPDGFTGEQKAAQGTEKGEDLENPEEKER